MGKDSHFTRHAVYSLVLKLLDKAKIRQISHDTQGCESYVKRFGGNAHLVVMLFWVLKYFDSLSELDMCLIYDYSNAVELSDFELGLADTASL